MNVYPIFFIFGLSGVGKTTFIEHLCEDRGVFQPKQVTTRAPRPDDTTAKYEYVSREQFLRSKGRFLMAHIDQRNCYGYKKSALKPNRINILYGLPTHISEIGFNILIQGDASFGLKKRGGDQKCFEQRERLNKSLQSSFYGNPVFRKKMDLILTNDFGKMEKITALFKWFALLKLAEQNCSSPSSLLFILSVYHRPIEGMKYEREKHAYWMKLALQNDLLRTLFYSKVLREEHL